PDALDIPTMRSYAEAIAVDGMWIFRVKQPSGSPPAFKAHYVARGFSQRHGVDFFQTFSPTPKMTTLRVLLHVAAQRDYELHSLDFPTAFLQGSLHEEIWLRRPPGFTGSFPVGTQWSLRRPVYGLRQAPREWHDTLRTTLAALGFAPSSADPSLFLRTDTTLPPFYVLVCINDLFFATADTEALALVLQRFAFQFSSPQPTPLSTGHSLSAPPSDESIEPSGPYPELVGCLMYLMTCTRPDLAYPLSLLARYVAPGRHRKVHWDIAKMVLRYLCSTSGMGLVLGGQGSVVLTGHSDASWADDQATQRLSQGYTFSLGFGSVSWRSTRSCYVLTSSCEAEIYTGAMAALELRLLTYLLTELGEWSRSPPVLLHVTPCCPARRALLQPASRPTAASVPCSAALHVVPCCNQRIAPYCSQRVAPCCPARRALLQQARRALLQPARRALLPCASCPAAACASRPTAARASHSAAPPCRALLPHTSRPAALHIARPTALSTARPVLQPAECPARPSRAARAVLPNPSRAALPWSPAPPSRPAATTAAAAASATAAAGGGSAGSAGSAAGAKCATGSAGGAAGAGGAGPTTDRHYLPWPLSRQLQQLRVDSGGHCLSWTTPPLSSFASGFFSEPVQVMEALVFYVLHRGGSRVAALGASDSAATLGASESAAALGASEPAAALGDRASPATGPSSAEALHTFTLDSGVSRCFFRDCTTLTPLAAPIPVSLADPTGGPVVAQASTVLPCPAVPSRSLLGLHLLTFSTNFVSNAAIQDVLVDTFIPGGQRVAICTCSRTGRHLATFTRRLGSSLYTLTTASAQVAEAGQVAASSQVSAFGQLAASCSCRVLSHQTLLWHHCLGHPSLPRLRGMHSRLLVSGLPRSLPFLPHSPARPCLPCVEGLQRAAPHSSDFPPTTVF
ncbi:unnamed protein product, partial [Closterium sp. NIES-54]